MKQMKFYTWLFIAIFLGCIFLGGCGGQQTSTPPSGTEGEEETPAPSAQTVELNFATWHPPTYPLNTGIWEPFCQDVEEQTEGRVKMYFHPGGVLVKGDETYDAVVTGTVDMGFTLQSYTTGRFPLSSIMEFPFLFTSSKQVCMTMGEMLKNSAPLQEEYGEVIPIWIGATDTSCLVTTKKINTIEDLKGLRIRTPGKIQNDVCDALGIIPISMPYAEVYDAIQRGVVDGTFGPQCSILEFSFHEVAQNMLRFDLYVTPLYVAMNKASWNKISPEDQAIIRGLMDQLPQDIGEQYDARLVADSKIWAENNLEVSSLPDEEMQKIHSLIEPLEEKWLTELEEKGLAAREVLADMRRLAEQFK